MTDTSTTATSDLLNGNTVPAGPLPPSAAEREAAFATMGKLRSDQSFQELYLRRDDAVVQEVERAHRVIHTGTKTVVNGQDPEMAPSMLGALQSFADVPPAVVDQIRSGQAVSVQEQAWAKNAKTRLFQDKEWVRLYLDGSVQHRTTLTLLNTILTSPTAK